MGWARPARWSTISTAHPAIRVVGIIFWLIRFAAFTSLVLLVGIPAVITLVWRPGGRTRRIGRLLWISWATLLFCSVVGIAIQGVYAAALPLTDIIRPSLFNEVLHTRFGEIEILRVILLVAFVPVVLVSPGAATCESRGVGHGGFRTEPSSGVGLLFTPGLAGHASTGSDVPFSMALDVFHLGAVAVWFGGLAVLAALLMPGLPPEDVPRTFVGSPATFSAYAFLAVIVVVATGVVQSLRQVGSFYALFNTVYGRTLLVKIGLGCGPHRSRGRESPHRSRCLGGAADGAPEPSTIEPASTIARRRLTNPSAPVSAHPRVIEQQPIDSLTAEVAPARRRGEGGGPDDPGKGNPESQAIRVG